MFSSGEDGGSGDEAGADLNYLASTECAEGPVVGTWYAGSGFYESDDIMIISGDCSIKSTSC